MARDPGLNTVTSLASDAGETVTVAAPYDALANPSNDDLIGTALSIWPPGPAWGSPDGQAVSLAHPLAKFTRVLVDSFEWLYQRIWTLARNASVKGVDELLPEWEAEYGLPDNCVTGETSIAERLRALETKVASQAIITPGDFIRIAATYGFVIEIEEPAIFECGFSECGGEHTVGDVRQECYWIVRTYSVAIDYFRCGESECGFDPLFTFGDGERLICILRRLAPAWTLPLLQIIVILTDGEGNALTDSDGNLLISGTL
ncbi:putative phage tail protein [Rhizobium sp. BK602]|uniref:putative phage tail protein n=1 Tax=Rhizobium sp. BK602 TaxID=2586986 RepID=UPI001611EBDA|nr:putative phage tail protein [Rhizobium sp. BK602]MBB3608680.1 uncharacterized protein YmfQ (DUF2313 family) [Rhizobium sp. BK602]